MPKEITGIMKDGFLLAILGAPLIYACVAPLTAIYTHLVQIS